MQMGLETGSLRLGSFGRLFGVCLRMWIRTRLSVKIVSFVRKVGKGVSAVGWVDGVGFFGCDAHLIRDLMGA